jgi:hypothetical protein
VDVIPDWRFEEMAPRYPLVVVPDWPAIGAETQRQVAAHLKSGGKAVIAGAENAALFQNLLGVRFAGPAAAQDAFIPGDEIFGQAKGVWQPVETDGAEVLERRFPTWDATRDAQVAATVRNGVAAIYGPVGSIYAISHTAAMRQFIRRVVDRVFTPMLKIDGPPTVEAALRRKDGRMLLHLVNCTGMQVAAEYMSQDFVAPVGPLRISLRLPARPRSVTLHPEGRTLSGTYANGTWTGALDRLEVHSIVSFG